VVSGVDIGFHRQILAHDVRRQTGAVLSSRLYT
jgi:hypothetical protein